ncbi:hypothetical protein MKS88_003975 [Plasmodium brasilianum]|uniref:Uncharacterized protein n=1 Tax=Plasmodium brasilianum TaxID=5824 RepID=A0ACB9Y6X1_PLABR|nr:hypothetical protein MKS88_003975 [Plasmodium brasilianum]
MEGENAVFEEILKKLPSYKIYNEFNSGDNIAKDSICKEEDYEKCPDKKACINLCKKIERNFKNLSEKRESEDYEKSCSHHTYWVNEEIMNLFKTNSQNSVEDIVNKFVKLGSILTETYRINNCNYYFAHKNLIDIKNKNEEKYLYDYFTNYESIRSKYTCNNVTIDKYKKYISAISNIYSIKEVDCCKSGMLTCPHYFLKCDKDFNPTNLLNELHSNEKESCNGLKYITTEPTNEQPDTAALDQEYMNSFYITACPILSNEKSSTNNRGMGCNLFRAKVNISSSVTADESNTQQAISTMSSADVQVLISSVYSESSQSQKSENQMHENGQVKKNNMSPEETIDDDVRWNFVKGTLNCLPNTQEKDEYGLCEYMEELVESGFFIKEKDSKGYKFKIGKKWDPRYLIRAGKNKRLWKSLKSGLRGFRNSGYYHVIKPNKAMDIDIQNTNGQINSGNYEKYNILNNTLFRISIGVTLVTGLILVFFLYYKFTPFGSRVGKIRKRKKRYRSNFADLNREIRSRKFLKRTYRHSVRRRFSVVNTDQ